MIAALVLLLQAASPAAQSWSVLAPPPEACRRAPGQESDIVVCGERETLRLPMPEDRGPPDHPVASNPELSAAQALNLEGAPCAAIQRGCIVGFGPPIVPTMKAAAGVVKSAFAKQPDRSGRVSIDLDAPSPKGRLEP